MNHPIALPAYLEGIVRIGKTGYKHDARLLLFITLSAPGAAHTRKGA